MRERRKGRGASRCDWGGRVNYGFFNILLQQPQRHLQRAQVQAGVTVGGGRRRIAPRGAA